MGLFKKTTGSDGQALQQGGHRINQAVVLTPTHHDAINPTNPGDMSHVRTVGIVKAPTYGEVGQAQAYEELANRTDAKLRESKRVYRALKRIERSDAQLGEVHRDYQIVVANAELHKKAADVKYARHLHAQRPQYAMLTNALHQGEQAATQQIGAYNQLVNQLAGA